VKWWHNALLSVEILFSHRLRTLLSLSGIIIGVSSVVIMVAAGTGAECEVVRRIESMGTNLVFVVAGKTRVSGGRIRRSSAAKTLKPGDTKAILAECPSVALASGSIKRSVIVRYQGETVKTGLIGLEPDGFVIRNFTVAQGREYTNHEERSNRRVAVFAPTARNNTFTNHKNPIGQAVRLAGQPFRVIGVTAPKGMDLSGSDQDDKIFIPLSTAMRRLVNVDYLDTIFVRVKDGIPLSRAEEEIREVIRRRHKLGSRGDDFSVYNLFDLLQLQKRTTRTLTLLTGSVAALAWLIGGIGILAVMLMAVRERRVEIGLRRALGAQAKDIRFQFLLEAGLLAGSGGLAGLLVGLFGVWLIVRMDWAPAVVSWPTAVCALAASVLMGLLSGAYPATRAASLTPIDALNSI
jgi:putative ABC transport system permease protein